MKRITLMKTSLAAGVLAFGLGATAAFAETVTLRMSTWLPPKHHHTATTLPAWIAAVEEASGGTLKIKIDPAPIAKPPRPVRHRTRWRSGYVLSRCGLHAWPI